MVLLGGLVARKDKGRKLVKGWRKWNIHTSLVGGRYSYNFVKAYVSRGGFSLGRPGIGESPVLRLLVGYG